MRHGLGGLVFAAAAVVVSVACSPNGGSAAGADAGCGIFGCGASSPETRAIASILLALEWEPDASTQQAMHTLQSALSVEEALYLEHLNWRGVTQRTAVADPVIYKGLAALSGASGTTTPKVVHLLSGGVVTPSITGDLYTDAAAVMQQCYGSATCNGPGCAAATLNAHLQVYGPVGSPPASPGYADQGAWQCTLSFVGKSGTGTNGEQCNLQGFCSNSSIDFNTGQFTCSDPGWMPGPSNNCAAMDAGSDAMGDAAMIDVASSDGSVSPQCKTDSDCTGAIYSFPDGKQSSGPLLTKCSPSGVCSECLTNSDCPPGLPVCNENTVAAPVWVCDGCATNADCPGGTTADPGAGTKCLPIDTDGNGCGCNVDEDCTLPNEFCNGGATPVSGQYNECEFVSLCPSDGDCATVGVTCTDDHCFLDGNGPHP
jgi:hypothetical protein